MGVVYRARDRETGRLVALKVVLSELGGQQALRFQREGELTARLQHPGIVRIYSSGIMRGKPYLAYELVEGRELGELLPGLELRRRIELIRDAARGLGHAHTQQIIHRDIKPENILVGVDGRARVADFGLATAHDVETLTKTGSALGTPNYMSPEQIGGETKSLGPTTDTWSLGVILYEALAGRLPFEEAESMVELAGKIMGGTITPPRAHRPAVPKTLEQICLKALSRPVADRYADGDALAHDLERYLSGESFSYGRSTGAKRLALAGAGAVAIALLVGLGWAATRTVPRPPPVAATVKRAAPSRSGSAKESKASLRRALARGTPEARCAALTRWLEQFPDEPGVAKATVARDEAQRLFPVATFQKFGDSLPGAARFVGDGRVLTFGVNVPIRLWNVEKPEEPVWEVEVKGFAGELAVAPGLKQAVLAARSRLALLDLETQEVSQLDRFENSNPSKLVFSQDGRRLAFSSKTLGATWVVSWPELEPLVWIELAAVRTLAFSSDGELIAVGGGGFQGQTYASQSRDGDFLEVWNVAGSEAMLRRRCGAPPRTLCFSPDNRFVVVGDTIGGLFRVDLANPEREVEFRPAPERSASATEILKAIRAHTGEVEGIVFSADGQTLFSAASRRESAGGDSELKAWSYPEGVELRRLRLGNPPRGLTRSPDMRTLLMGNSVGGAEIHLAY
jgi:hypothetical protein